MGKHILAALIAVVAIGLFASLRQVHADYSYTVQSGDSLSSIAQTKLGNADKWTDIYQANKDQIANPNIIYEGEMLTIPSPHPQAVSLFADADRPVNTSLTQSVTEEHVIHPSSVTYTASYHPAPVHVVTAVRGQNAYQAAINAAASANGVSASLMTGIIACESGFNPNAYNASSGATGIAQFKPATWASPSNPYRNQSIYDPIAQINAMAYKIAHGGVTAWACYFKL